MSYVVNDDIPKSCSKCPQRTLYHGINVCLAANKMKVNVSNKCRHENCLLIEIPTPHGRLIDADALLRVIEENSYRLRGVTNSTENGMFLTGIRQAIDESPTIIEAEVSE